jgi:hypothetical protein
MQDDIEQQEYEIREVDPDDAGDGDEDDSLRVHVDAYAVLNHEMSIREFRTKHPKQNELADELEQKIGRPPSTMQFSTGDTMPLTYKQALAASKVALEIGHHIPDSVAATVLAGPGRATAVQSEGRQDAGRNFAADESQQFSATADAIADFEEGCTQLPARGLPDSDVTPQQSAFSESEEDDPAAQQPYQSDTDAFIDQVHNIQGREPNVDVLYAMSAAMASIPEAPPRQEPRRMF